METREKKNRKKIDSDVVVSFIEGDIAAFNEIYEYYHKSVYYFALKIMKNKIDAEEVLQDTFVSVFENAKSLKDPTTFHAWLFTIAFNKTQSMFRKRKRSRIIETRDDVNFEELVYAQDNQVDRLEKTEIYEAIEGELNQLPPKFFEVGMLHYYEGIPVQEISEILKIPEGTVKSRLRRIRKTIRPALGKKGYTPSKYFSFSLAPVAFQIYDAMIQNQAVNDNIPSAIPHELLKQAAAIGAGSAAVLGKTVVGSGKVAISKGLASTILAGGALGSLLVFTSLQGTQEDAIQEINYQKEKTNQTLEVKAKISESASKDQITVEKAGKSLPFDVNKNTLSFHADENGDYTIRIGDSEKSVVINNIDKVPPVLSNVAYENNLLKFDITDDKSNIDYATSYIEYEGKQIAIPSTHTIEGKFNGEVKVIIFDTSQNSATYIVKVDK